jgi:putative ABC transport system substrate-binding protein
MKRRTFFKLLAGTALAGVPLIAQAQQPGKIWRIGMLDTTPAALNAANIGAFRLELARTGYVEGTNLIIEYRSGEGRPERFPDLAAELIRLNVDIIVTRGTPAAMAAKKASTTLPIVMAAIGEPVETGMVASLAQPGGNITGLSAFVTELTAKRAEIIRDVVPGISRIALLDNMSNGSVPAQWDEAKRAALALGMQPQLHDVRKPEDIEASFSAMVAERADWARQRRHRQSHARHRARRQTPVACDLCKPGVRRSRRLAVLRTALRRSLSPRRHLRR